MIFNLYLNNFALIHWFFRSFPSVCSSTIFVSNSHYLFQKDIFWSPVNLLLRKSEWLWPGEHRPKITSNWGKSRYHSYHVLVYISPVLTYLLVTVSHDQQTINYVLIATQKIAPNPHSLPQQHQKSDQPSQGKMQIFGNDFQWFFRTPKHWPNKNIWIEVKKNWIYSPNLGCNRGVAPPGVFIKIIFGDGGIPSYWGVDSNGNV